MKDASMASESPNQKAAAEMRDAIIDDLKKHDYQPRFMQMFITPVDRHFRHDDIEA